MEVIEDEKEVVMEYCGTEDMLADSLTNPWVGTGHAMFVKLSGLH
jgi:hypothetical protein